MTNEIDETKDEHDWEEEVRGACRAHLSLLCSRVRARHVEEAATLDRITAVCDGKATSPAMALRLVRGLDALIQANPMHRLAVEILMNAADPADWD